MNRLVLVFFLALLLFAESDLPDYGDPEAPASLYISSTYIEDSLEDTQTPNIVIRIPPIRGTGIVAKIAETLTQIDSTIMRSEAT